MVLVTALDGRADRIAGLEAGADEFLTKPIDDVMLFARVRSLTRLKLVIDELRQREASGRRIGVIAGAAARLAGAGGRVLIVDDNERQAQRLAAELAVEHRPVVEADPDKAHADRPRPGRPGHRQRHRQDLRRPAVRRPAALRRGHPPPADPGPGRSGRPAAR